MGQDSRIGKIEEARFVGSQAAMATLVSEVRGKPEKPNPGCVRFDRHADSETWNIARVQAIGAAPPSRSAAVKPGFYGCRY